MTDLSARPLMLTTPARRNAPRNQAALMAAISLSAMVGLASQPAIAGTIELDPLNVEGTQPSADENTGQLGYTVKSTTSSTGMKLTPRQTPQSVTTITQEQMADRQITNIEQALDSAPGVTMSKSEVGGRTEYRARGYPITNWKTDGLQFQGGSDFSGAGSSLNMDMYERIDIVRGANGLLGGTGDPSATVNLIRKRPG